MVRPVRAGKPDDDARPATIDDGIGELRRHDFAPQAVRENGIRIFLLHRLGEIALEFLDEIGDHPARSRRGGDRRARASHRRAAPPISGRVRASPRAERASISASERQALRPGGQAGPRLRGRASDPDDFRVGRDAGALRKRERQGLQVVVPQHELADLVGHRGQQHVALFTRQAAIALGFGERDLEIDLHIRGIHAGGIVDGIGVELHAVPRGLDARRLRHAEVGTFADDAGVEFRAR